MPASTAPAHAALTEADLASMAMGAMARERAIRPQPRMVSTPV